MRANTTRNEPPGRLRRLRAVLTTTAARLITAASSTFCGAGHRRSGDPRFATHLFPRDTNRQTWEKLEAQLTQRQACKDHRGAARTRGTPRH